MSGSDVIKLELPVATCVETELDDMLVGVGR